MVDYGLFTIPPHFGCSSCKRTPKLSIITLKTLELPNWLLHAYFQAEKFLMQNT